jgi:hypothetical protein
MDPFDAFADPHGAYAFYLIDETDRASISDAGLYPPSILSTPILTGTMCLAD